MKYKKKHSFFDCRHSGSLAINNFTDKSFNLISKKNENYFLILVESFPKYISELKEDKFHSMNRNLFIVERNGEYNFILVTIDTTTYESSVEYFTKEEMRNELFVIYISDSFFSCCEMKIKKILISSKIKNF